MSTLQKTLPQLSGAPFLTDGGLETTLIFHQGVDLPHFAAFTLLQDDAGRALLRDYYRSYAAVAQRYETGFILESPNWRANPDWGAKLGYNKSRLAQANREGIGLMHEIREEFETPESPMVISGCIGPRGDGYEPTSLMSADEAASYHAAQIRSYRDAGVDLVSGFTINYLNEAIGITHAAAAYDLPVAISFTVETDGRLPTGQTLREAIEAVEAQSSRAPAYYMINCAHPTHLTGALAGGGDWLKRVRGYRANASRRSHAELNDSPDLDDGNPDELGSQYQELLTVLSQLTVFGGCCGTDLRHVEAIGRAVTPVFSPV